VQHAGGVSGHDQAGCSEAITQSLRPSGSAWQLTISPNVVARSSLLGKKLQNPVERVEHENLRRSRRRRLRLQEEHQRQGLFVGRLATGVNIPGERQGRSMARGKDGDFSMAVD